MLKRARERAAKLNINVQFSLADAEALPFRDRCFDTVTSSLSTRTFPNPAEALHEMSRVSKPSGQILLVEHGRSDRGCLPAGKTAMRTNLPSRLVATGTANRWSLLSVPV
jgi:ubiquinone/menaquinone biosynthesis C-methylase UbiE